MGSAWWILFASAISNPLCQICKKLTSTTRETKIYSTQNRALLKYWIGGYPCYNLTINLTENQSFTYLVSTIGYYSVVSVYVYRFHSNVFQLSGLDFAVPFREDGVSYQNYIKYQINLRMRLLLLRQTNPNLFSEPIPLSEATIQSSELYKQIISKHYPTVSMDLLGEANAEVVFLRIKYASEINDH